MKLKAGKRKSIVITEHDLEVELPRIRGSRSGAIAWLKTLTPEVVEMAAINKCSQRMFILWMGGATYSAIGKEFKVSGARVGSKISAAILRLLGAKEFYAMVERSLVAARERSDRFPEVKIVFNPLGEK